MFEQDETKFKFFLSELQLLMIFDNLVTSILQRIETYVTFQILHRQRMISQMKALNPFKNDLCKTRVFSE